MRKRLSFLGGIALGIWGMCGIAPYLLNMRKWECSQGTARLGSVFKSVFWEIYYTVGLMGGWEFCLIFGCACLLVSYVHNMQRLGRVLLSVALASLLVTVLTIITGNWVRAAMIALE